MAKKNKNKNHPSPSVLYLCDTSQWTACLPPCIATAFQASSRGLLLPFLRGVWLPLLMPCFRVWLWQIFAFRLCPLGTRFFLPISQQPTLCSFLLRLAGHTASLTTTQIRCYSTKPPETVCKGSGKPCSNKALFIKVFGEQELPVGHSSSPPALGYKIVFGKAKLLSGMEPLQIHD